MMKNATVASLIAAALIAPSVTFAQSAVFDFPTFYPEFTEQTVQPATKLDINSTSDTTPAPNKANDKK